MKEKISMGNDWKNDDGSHFERHAGENLLAVYPWLLQDFFDILHCPVTGAAILEIGCGPGFMLQQFSAHSPSLLVGLDRSLSMLERAADSNRASNANLVQGDAGSLPFGGALFDAVFSRGSVFFWPDLPAAFFGIRKCLRPGGQALIGGGYGLSTPAEIIDRLRSKRSADEKSGIPKLDPSEIVTIMHKIGGTARVLQAERRGFWVHWQV